MEYFLLSECEGLGFHNASRNACGFCTGGTTMLSDKYYINCAGKCEGNKTSLDCHGDCKGSAYIDECSGECIGGNSPKTERDVESYRDCRGGCTSSGNQLFTDSCGVCHAGTSPFQDCTNRCYLPGKERFMARPVCGRCVGGTTGIRESEVLDPCGNCRNDGIECPCNGTGNPDPCGVCNGGGVSCMRVIRFQPRALPVNTKATPVALATHPAGLSFQPSSAILKFVITTSQQTCSASGLVYYAFLLRRKFAAKLPHQVSHDKLISRKITLAASVHAIWDLVSNMHPSIHETDTPPPVQCDPSREMEDNKNGILILELVRLINVPFSS
ncbi:hypothetical protein AVEN_23554-1 [Araneus ventricosus]|uniref:Uncharacterized protein n=1 Tax=Araneus ventricosus TaxID=182803 RepID=A0A4Y2QF24_ARAVE|nr:hypothetical protein AVEN_23554-1 [Araneus ventricosus]